MAYNTTHGIKDLSAFAAISTAMFVKWVVPVLGTTLLSDYNTDVTIDGDVYSSIGQLLTITQATSELRASPASLMITISGIPAGTVTNMLDNDIKGSTVKISRIYDNKQGAEEGAFVVFNGIVTNYSITDTVNTQSKTASTVITLNVNNIVEILNKKVNGRKTNPEDFPGDVAFDRVRVLQGKKYGFGGANT